MFYCCCFSTACDSAGEAHVLKVNLSLQDAHADMADNWRFRLGKGSEVLDYDSEEEHAATLKDIPKANKCKAFVLDSQNTNGQFVLHSPRSL